MAVSKRSKLETQLRNAETKLAHKREIMQRHQPGTAWHTRASLEAASVESRIAGLRQRLASIR